MIDHQVSAPAFVSASASAEDVLAFLQSRKIAVKVVVCGTNFFWVRELGIEHTKAWVALMADRKTLGETQTVARMAALFLCDAQGVPVFPAGTPSDACYRLPMTWLNAIVGAGMEINGMTEKAQAAIEKK